MKDRQRTEEYYADAKFRHEMNHSLVTGWFRERLNYNDIEDLTIEPIEFVPEFVITATVAVLDLPRSNILERAAWLDRNHRGRTRRKDLLTFHAQSFKDAVDDLQSYEKARREALCELSGEMANRIIEDHYRRHPVIIPSHSKELANMSQDAVRELF